MTIQCQGNIREFYQESDTVGAILIHHVVGHISVEYPNHLGECIQMR